MDGFFSPNYTQTPNDLFDTHLAKMGEAELKVILAIIRLTLGYHKTAARASLTRLQEMTGLSRQGVIDGATAAEAKRFIIKAWDGGVTEWILNINEDQAGGDQPARQSSKSGQASRPTGQRSRPTGQPTRPPTSKENLVNKSDKENVGADAPAGSKLAPDTEGAYRLFNLLGDNLAAMGRRSPKNFPSLACKEKFLAAENRLGHDLEKAIRRSLEKSILSISGIVDFVAKWQADQPPSPQASPGRRPGGSSRPPIVPDDPENKRSSARALIEQALQKKGDKDDDGSAEPTDK